MGSLLLFLAMLFALPLPMLGLEGSLVPAARYWQLGLVCVGVIVTEGAQGIAGVFAGLLLGHAVVFTTLLAGGSALFARLVLRRASPLLRDHVVVLLTTFLLATASFGAIYDSQFHHSSAHASLLDLYF